MSEGFVFPLAASGKSPNNFPRGGAVDFAKQNPPTRGR